MAEYLVFSLGFLAVVVSIVVGLISAYKQRATKVMRKHGVLEHQRSLQQFKKSRKRSAS